MRRRIAHGLIRSMEDEQQSEMTQGTDEQVEALAEAGSPDLDPAPEAAAAEEVAQDIQAEETQIEETADTVEALESMAMVVRQASLEGGLNRTSAALVRNQMAYHQKRLGASRRVPMPSMESFGGVSSRLSATNVTMEGIKDLAKTAWDAIVKAMRRVISFFQEYYNKFFGGAERLKARAEKLAKVTVEGKLDEKSGDDAGLASRLHMSKVTSFAKLKEGLETVKKLVDASQGASKTVTDKIETFCDNDAETVTKETLTTLNTEVNEAMKLNGSLTEANGSSLNDVKGSDTSARVFASTEIPGGNVLYVRESGSTGGLSRASGISLTPLDSKATATKVEWLAGPNNNDIANMVAGIAGALVFNKSGTEKAQKVREKIAKFAERAAKVSSNESYAFSFEADGDAGDSTGGTNPPAGGSTGGTNPPATKDPNALAGAGLRSAINNLKDCVGKPFDTVAKEALAIGTAALNLVDKSIRLHSK